MTGIQKKRQPLSFPEPTLVETAPVSVPPVVSPPAVKSAAAEGRQQVGARIDGVKYRQLKAHAALQGVTVQTLVEQAVTEFLSKVTS